jgi:uncharacterized membrane protein
MLSSISSAQILIIQTIMNSLLGHSTARPERRGVTTIWKVTMRTSNTRARKFSSTVVKILMALVFASMIGGISIAPAFGFYIGIPGLSISSGSGIDLAFPGGDCGYYDDGGYYAGGGYGGGGRKSICHAMKR